MGKNTPNVCLFDDILTVEYQGNIFIWYYNKDGLNLFTKIGDEITCKLIKPRE